MPSSFTATPAPRFAPKSLPASITYPMMAYIIVNPAILKSAG